MHAAFALWLTSALVGLPVAGRTILIAAGLSAMGQAGLVVIATSW
ncbi:MAG: hypothetical protein AB1666_02680 [Pseudomonadota bacterium]